MKTLRYFEHESETEGYTLADDKMLTEANFLTEADLQEAFGKEGTVHLFTLAFPSQDLCEQITRDSTDPQDDGTLRTDPLRLPKARACSLVKEYTKVTFRQGQEPLRESGIMTGERFGSLHGNLAYILEAVLSVHQFPAIGVNSRFSKALQSKSKPSKAAAK